MTETINQQIEDDEAMLRIATEDSLIMVQKNGVEVEFTTIGECFRLFAATER